MIFTFFDKSCWTCTHMLSDEHTAESDVTHFFFDLIVFLYLDRMPLSESVEFGPSVVLHFCPRPLDPECVKSVVLGLT